jgi:ferrous iron transport protein B
MHKIGLHGKSFIPMLIGFGCTVPAVLATRTIETRRDRLTTMMVLPLMSCSARLPIYALIIPAFFPVQWRGPLLWSIYLIGIVLAIVGARVLRRTVFRGEAAPFVMELPPFHVPTLKGLLVHMWERSSEYLRKAGTVILAAAVVLWALATFPQKRDYDRDYAAEAHAAWRQYRSAVGRLGEPAGLSTGSNRLADVLADELNLPAWASRPADLETPAAGPGEGPPAAATAPADSSVTIFLRLRREIRRLRAEFDRKVRQDGLEPGSMAYAEVAVDFRAALDSVRAGQPETYELVNRYLDEAEGPFRQRISHLRRARRSEDLAYSVVGRVGHAVEPALKPLGFDWRIGTALMGALSAKELFVAQLGIIYSVGEPTGEFETLRGELRANYTPLTGFCIMLFCLITAPCVATVIATGAESGSWKWALAQFGGLTALAYVVTLAVRQIGGLFV